MHLLCSCVIARWFWREFINWCNSLHSEKTSALSKKEIVYGVLNGWSSSSTLNYLILIGKYFLYSNALEENIEFQIADYVNFVYEKLRVEKRIYFGHDKYPNCFCKKMA